MQLAEVVSAAQEGNKEAFDQLVIRFQDMAYASAYAITGDSQLAQDAAQEAFLDAYQNLAHLREPAAFPGWFSRIVLGRSHRLARAKVPASVPLEDALEFHHALPDSPGYIHSHSFHSHSFHSDSYSDSQSYSLRDPQEIVQQKEAAQDVQAAIAALSPNLRLAIALYYIEGYSQREIADYLETTVSTVKKRLFDARQRLKKGMIHMVQEQLQANRPSQNDEFARRVQFFTALLASDLAQIEQLLRQDPTLLTARAEWKMALKRGYWPLGSTALHLAVAGGDRAAAELLLSFGAPVNAENVGEITPLHLAAIMQRPEMVRLLLAHGASIDARSKINQTALHHAALRGDQATMQVLLEQNADLTAVDREGHMPVDLAALRGDQKSVDFLVAQGSAQPSVAIGASGWPRLKAESPLLSTGIKAVDLFAPLPRGGIAGVFTPLAGVGFFVVLAQLVNSMAEIYNGFSIYLGLESFPDYGEGIQLSWQEMGVTERVTYLFGSLEDGDAQRMKLVEQGIAIAKEKIDAGHEVLLLLDSNLACTPGALPYVRSNARASSGDAFPAITTIVHGHHTVRVLPEVLAEADLTSVITFNGLLARLQLWPTIDPVRSYSSLFGTPLVDDEHGKLVIEVRRLLTRYMDLHPVVESGGVEALWYIDDDPHLQQTITRARRLQRFLTQPFYGAEPWTGIMGQLVPLEETIRGCQAILRGDYDSLPEEAFAFVGVIEEAVAKARTSSHLNE